MDFSLGEKSEQFRREVREFLDEVLTPEVLDRCHESGVSHDAEFSKAVRERGYLALGWPVEHGGRGLDALEVLPYLEETQRANAPTYGIATTMMIAHVINAVGTEEQKREILPRAFAADIVIVLGFTEPENGSDAAAAATKAVRDGDGWRITGSKMFTTNAHIADYVFMLARTDTDKPKHAGLTTFLVPMDQPGVEVRAVHTLSGERTNVTFYNDVYVSDLWRIGDVDGGWKVMNVAFAAEHASSWVGEQSRLLSALIKWARTAVDGDGRPASGRDDVQQRIGKSRAEVEISRLLQRRAAWYRASNDKALHGRGSMSKLFSTERLQQQADETLLVVGPDSLRAKGDPSEVQGGTIEHMVRHAKGTTIYAGTSEIQRNIIAQHVLGLPRPS
jgi:alkylation response protein AidB-like acyl-CoA dehydrogenase